MAYNVNNNEREAANKCKRGRKTTVKAVDITLQIKRDEGPLNQVTHFPHIQFLEWWMEGIKANNNISYSTDIP